MFSYKVLRKYFLLFLSTAIIFTAVYMVDNIYDLFRNMKVIAITFTGQEEDALEDQTEQNDKESMDPVTLLVYGTDAGVWEEDQEQEDKGNADTIILIKVYPESGNIALLSIPRDTLASIPGHHQTKINHSLSYGGSELLVETVEDFTGCLIDYYVGFDFYAVRIFIDLIGGIEFYLDRDFIIGESLLEAGLQKLDGEQALAVIRSRQDPMGDIERVKRQQRFLETMVGEISDLSLEELFFLGVVTWGQVDTNLDIMKAINLADAFIDISTENLEMEVLPGRFLNIDDISYWEVDPARKEEIINDLFESYEYGGVESDN
jgi:polyisoprenyl-teichoic acid--peptidoglycan teichoic acid transferase